MARPSQTAECAQKPAIDIDEVILCTQARAKRVILVMQFQLDSVKSAACARYVLPVVICETLLRLNAVRFT